MQRSSRSTLRIGDGWLNPVSGEITRILWAGCALIVVLIAVAFLLHDRYAVSRQPSTVTATQQRSVAVLPFLDLTDGIRNEALANGVTQGLIDKLSTAPGLRVPSANMALSLKDNQGSVSQTAQRLGVAYVLDGTVRKAGSGLRVSARLTRADNGDVLWSETYDRPAGDLHMVQDDIAADVREALTHSVDGPR